MSTVSKVTETKRQLGSTKTLPAGTKLERHPLSASFPDPTKEQAESLRNSLRTHGQLNPIVRWDDKIIDGWWRYSQLTSLNQPLLISDYVGDDPVGFVYVQNYCRRDLTDQQRLVVTAKLTNLKQGKPKAGAKQVNLALSLKQAAELTHFSESTIKKVKKILDSKNNDLIEGIESEKISIDMGTALIDKPKEQIKAVLSSNNPKKTFKELTSSSDEGQPKTDGNASASEKDAAEVLLAHVQDAYKNFSNTQQERFREQMKRFLMQVLPDESKKDEQNAPENGVDRADMIEGNVEKS